jgi:hypothetical protein
MTEHAGFFCVDTVRIMAGAVKGKGRELINSFFCGVNSAKTHNQGWEKA